jgi:ribosomal protein S18 acetylase RimI-like enzyme
MTAPDTQTGVTIERLEPAQIAALEPLWRSLIDHIRELGSVVEIVPHEESWPRRQAIYEELLADGESFALGARRDGRLIGYAVVHVAPPDAVWFTGDRYAELTSLCVAADERGGGLGTALLDAVEAGLLERGLDQYVIGVDTVNPDAQRFYERRGFRDGFHLMHGWVGGGRGGDGSGDGRSGSASGSNGSPETAMHGDD